MRYEEHRIVIGWASVESGRRGEARVRAALDGSPRVERIEVAAIGPAPTQVEHIFHIALRRDWDAARLAGEYRISTLGATLEEVGFIHGSFRQQVERIGTFLYGGVGEPLTVLRIDPTRLSSPVRVENLDGGSELFPHIYGPVAVEAVVATMPARAEHGRFFVEWDAAP